MCSVAMAPGLRIIWKVRDLTHLRRVIRASFRMGEDSLGCGGESAIRPMAPGGGTQICVLSKYAKWEGQAGRNDQPEAAYYV